MPRLSPTELASRRSGLGSTCIVEANGLAPWKGAGPMRLFNEKLGIVSPDDADELADEDDNDRAEWLEWGHTLEPVIADWYERTRGVKLQLGGHVPSVEHPFIWSTLDRTIIGANKGIEIKNVGSPTLYRHWDTSSQDGVPNYVRAQVTAHMHCTGFREWDVAASIGGRPPHVWTVAYDSELAELLIAGAVKFWQLVKNGTPPPLDATPATRAYLLSKYPANLERAMRKADEWAEDLAAIRVDAARQYAEAKTAKTVMDRTTNELLALVGDADGIEGIGWKMTWKLDKNLKRRPRFTGKGSEE